MEWSDASDQAVKTTRETPTPRTAPYRHQPRHRSTIHRLEFSFFSLRSTLPAYGSLCRKYLQITKTHEYKINAGGTHQDWKPSCSLLHPWLWIEILRVLNRQNSSITSIYILSAAVCLLEITDLRTPWFLGLRLFRPSSI